MNSQKHRRRINLITPEFLPVEQERLTPAVLGTMVALLLIWGVGLGWTDRRLQAEKANLEAEKARLVAKATELRSQQVGQGGVDARRKLLSDLVARRAFWSNPMKELTMRIPHGIWLDELVAGAKDGKKTVEIKGTAGSAALFTEFFQALEDSYFYKNVMIDFSEMDSSVSPPVYRFRVYGPIEDLKGKS